MVKYQIEIASDSKCSVVVVFDNRDDSEAAQEWAQMTYQRIMAGNGERVTRTGEPTGQTEEATPTCGVHQMPMVQVQGRKGLFWSCHERGQDGKFCTYRPNGK